MNDTIFTPNFETTAEMQGHLDNIGRISWLIQNMLIMPKHEAWIRRQVWVRRAAATTQIEGASMNEAQVEELRKKGHPGKLTDDEQENLDALQAYEFVDYASDEPDISPDEMVIRQLNREFLRGAPEHLVPGRYRNGQNTVGPYTTPDQGDIPTLMRAYSDWLKSDSEMHPVLKAGIAHIQFVAIHPFWDGNGRVARGLATLVLQRSEYHFKKLLSLESLLYRTRDEYFGAIERTLGKGYSPGYDATPWLEFFVRAVVTHAFELQIELTDWHRQMESVYKALEKADMNHRQADGVIFAIRMGQITRSDYLEITGVSHVTASRDLRQLVSKGWLTPRGQTRARVYLPKVPGKRYELPPEQGQLFDIGGVLRKEKREEE